MASFRAPGHTEGAFGLECLAGIARQTHPVSGVLVVDNASTDGTEAALEASGLGGWFPLDYLRLAREFVSSRLGLTTLPEQHDLVVTALQALAPQVVARRQERTYVVDLSVTTRHGEKSAMIANAIVAAYLEDQASARTTAAKRATDALSRWQISSLLPSGSSKKTA